MQTKNVRKQKSHEDEEVGTLVLVARVQLLSMSLWAQCSVPFTCPGHRAFMAHVSRVIRSLSIAINFELIESIGQSYHFLGDCVHCLLVLSSISSCKPSFFGLFVCLLEFLERSFEAMSIQCAWPTMKQASSSSWPPTSCVYCVRV